MTEESVVKDCTTAAVVVAGERASNRGIKNIPVRSMIFFTAAAHLSAIHREGDGGKLLVYSSHCLHGETHERQPGMFDKAPEKRSLNRWSIPVLLSSERIQRHSKTAAVNKRLRGKTAAVNKRLRGVSALALFKWRERGLWSMHKRKLS